MTAKTMKYDTQGQPTKMPGWFSWRHQTRDAHDEAREKYLAQHGRAARRRKAAERAARSV